MDWLEYLQGRRDTCLEAIASLESGQTTTGTRIAGSDWQDTTAESLANFKDEVATIDAILAQHGS